jgi:hypothetical protein
MATVNDFTDAGLGLLVQWGSQKLAPQVRPAPPVPSPMPAPAPAPTRLLPPAADTAAAKDTASQLVEIIQSPITLVVGLVIVVAVYLVKRRRG